jgi:hypothetical protein
MDVVKAVETYVEKMIDSVSGLKVLLLDEETVLSHSRWPFNFLFPVDQDFECSVLAVIPSGARNLSDGPT